MAVPDSGEISLFKIRHEIVNNDYNHNGVFLIAATSLTSLSNGSFGTINTGNAATDRPNGSAPHSMSEFYSYDHDVSSVTYTSRLMYVNEDSAFGACNSETTYYIYHDENDTWSAADTIWYTSNTGATEVPTQYYREPLGGGIFYDGGEKEPFLCGRSERRLKYNIEFIGDSSMGIPMYHFNYKDESHGKGRFVGTMVDDLQRLGFEDSLFEENGEIWVNYHKLDVPFESVSI